MAYCRSGADSNVYMFATAGEHGTTDYCFYYSFIGEGTSFTQVNGIRKALRFFAKLRLRRYIFPESATERLHTELKEENKSENP
jgi:hypothetical protein